MSVFWCSSSLSSAVAWICSDFIPLSLLQNCRINHIELFWEDITVRMTFKLDLSPSLPLFKMSIPMMAVRWSFLTLTLVAFNWMLNGWMYNAKSQEFPCDVKVLTKAVNEKCRLTLSMPAYLFLCGVSISGVLVVEMSSIKKRSRHLASEESCPWEQYC